MYFFLQIKHSGPETTEKELNALVQKLKDDQKSLCSSLNLEIRLRKLSLDKV